VLQLLHCLLPPVLLLQLLLHLMHLLHWLLHTALLFIATPPLLQVCSSWLLQPVLP
jgi:hypothetical protein